MLKKILLPTDFSKNALVAANYAIELAGTLNYHLHIVHFYKPYTSPFQSQLANESDERRSKLGAEKGMTDFIKTIRTRGTVQMSSELCKGNLGDSIHDYTAENIVEMIIMGTHGASGSRKDLLGSNTYDVVKQLNIPVLVVPEQAITFKAGHAVFFTDYLQEDFYTLNVFKNIFSNSNPKCTLVHINSASTAEKEKLEGWRKKLSEGIGWLLQAKLADTREELEAVNHVIQDIDAELTLITLAGRKNFFEGLLHKSLAKAIILHPQTPVFVTGKA